jgi:hypothetical protein
LDLYNQIYSANSETHVEQQQQQQQSTKMKSGENLNLIENLKSTKIIINPRQSYYSQTVKN